MRFTARAGVLASPAPVDLPRIGTVVERSFDAACRPLEVRLRLNAGDFARLQVEPLGKVDLSVQVLSTAQRASTVFDRQLGPRGSEPVTILAAEAGLHTLVVRAWGPCGGAGARLMLLALRPAADGDRAHFAVALAVAQAELLRRTSVPAHLQRAAALYDEALSACALAPAACERARLLAGLGATLVKLERWAPALARLAEARAAAVQLADRQTEAWALVESVAALRRLGRPGAARRRAHAALGLAQTLDDPAVQATALHWLGILAYDEGDAERAAGFQVRALEVWDTLGRPELRAAAVHGLGEAHLLLGLVPLAKDRFEEALNARPAHSQPRGHADSRAWLALTASHLGDHEAAARQAQEAAQVYGELRYALDQAWVLMQRGDSLLAQGQCETAWEQYRAARDLARDERERTLGALEERVARALTACRRWEEAQAAFGRAQRLLRRAGDDDGLAHLLVHEAGLWRDRGEFDPARRRARQALELLERLRGRVRSDAARRTFLAVRQQLYELLIDLSFEAGGATGGEAAAERAFEVSEQGRARVLLDGLAQPGLRSVPLRLAELRRRVLDDDTWLLAYALGDERSYVWLIGRTSIEAAVLPARREIEEQARALHQLLQDSRATFERQEADWRAEHLADTLLPASLRAGRIPARRLVVIPDGALQYLPFSALRVRESQAAGAERVPLVTLYEIAHAPSAAVLAILGASGVGPRSRLAVFSNPKTPLNDAQAATPDAAGRPPRHGVEPEFLRHLQRQGQLDPLPRSSDEARHISRLVPPDRHLWLDGVAATRAAVLDGRLRGYDILHFAVHAWVDPSHPELSALVLSTVDEQGQSIPGLLRARDLREVRLDADLVVLSACETALGASVRGEGLVGLTQAFLLAGARRVIASHWRVDDRATAAFMASFYDRLLGRGLDPARALRGAQLEALKQGAPPADWAAFTFAGRW